jgi:hypothetical protein
MCETGLRPDRREGNHHPERCKTRMEHINFHFRQDTEHCFDFETIENALKEAGFVEIRQRDLTPTSIQRLGHLERYMSMA